MTQTSQPVADSRPEDARPLLGPAGVDRDCMRAYCEISGSDGGRVLSQEVARAAGGVVRIRHATSGRTSRACLAVIGCSQGGLFLRREVMLGQSTILSAGLAGSTLAFLACAILACPILACAILACAILALAILASATGMTSLMGVGAVKVCKEQSIDDRAPARHPDHCNHQQKSRGLFHDRVSKDDRPTGSQINRRAKRLVGMHREGPRPHPREVSVDWVRPVEKTLPVTHWRNEAA